MSRHLYPHVFGSGPTIVSPLSLRHYAKRMALPCGFTTMGDQGGSWTPAMQLESTDPLLWMRFWATDQGISTGGARDFEAASSAQATRASFAAVNLSTTDFSIVSNLHRETTGNMVIAAKYQDADNYWRFEITAGHKLHFIAVVATVTLIEVTGTTSLDSLATWYHCAVVVDRDGAGTTEIYMNGVNDTAGTPTVSASSIDNTGAFFLGESGAGTLFYDGRLSLVGVFKNDLLTQAEITWDYNLGRGKLHGSFGEVGTDGANLAPSWFANCNETATAGDVVDQVAAANLTTAVGLPAVDGPSSDIAPDTGSVGTAHGQLIGFADSETARSTDTADGSPNPTVEDQAGTYDGLMVGFAAPDTARSAHGLTGVPGQAVTFDGTDDKIVGSAAAFPSGAATRTVSFWMRTNNIGTGQRFAFTYGGTGTGNDLFAIGQNTDKIYFSTATTPVSGSVTISAATWYHITATYNGTRVKVYINGVLDIDSAVTVNTVSTTLVIGNGFSPYSWPWDGEIADIRVYSSVLADPDIATIAAGDSGATGSPVLRYDFNEADTRTLTTIGSGTSLVFDGVDDYVSCGSIGAVTAISLYVKLLIDNQEILTLTNSTTTAVTVAAGVLTFGASLTASAITVDGVSVSAADAGATLNDNAWHLLTFSLTSISATDCRLGTDGSNFGQIMLDQVSVNAGTNAWTFDEPTSLSVTDGDPIAIAQSLEGSRYQLLNATASERPDYVASAINGKPGLEFDGVDDLLEYVGVPLTGTAGTVIAVCKVKAVPDAYQTLLASSDTATATKYTALHIRGNTANGHIGYGQNNAGTEDLLDGDTAVADELECAVYWASNGTTVTARLNGTAQTLSADTGANNGDWWDDSTGKDTTTIGALKHTSETNHAAIILCELIAYPINLSDASRATVAAYVLREYGLTL